MAVPYKRASRAHTSLSRDPPTQVPRLRTLDKSCRELATLMLSALGTKERASFPWLWLIQALHYLDASLPFHHVGVRGNPNVEKHGKELCVLGLGVHSAARELRTFPSVSYSLECIIPMSLTQGESPPTTPAIDPFGIKPHERKWVILQPQLEHKGYMLRPRYRRGWVGSWNRTGRNPVECEDSIIAPMSVIDAVRISDGSQVMLKVWYGPNSAWRLELPITQYFSTEPQASDPRNHCVPLLEFFPLMSPDGPDPDGFEFMVQPLFRDWRDPPFKMVIEALSFIRHLLEGLVFMHSHNVAHRNHVQSRDICVRNILMDARALLPDGFHGAFNLNVYHRLSEGGLRILTRLEVPVKYYYIDFGLSSKFDSFEDRHPVVWEGGVCDTLPELRTDKKTPYDPFKADIYALGDMFERNLNGLWTGLEFMRPLFAAMMQERPEDRPTAAEAMALFQQMTRDLPRWRLLAWTRFWVPEYWWKVKEGWLYRLREFRIYLRQLWQAVVLNMGREI